MLTVYEDIKKGELVYIPDVAQLIVKQHTTAKAYMAKQDMAKGLGLSTNEFHDYVEPATMCMLHYGDTPSENGQYVAYVEGFGRHAKKILLTFIDGQWIHSGSDQSYRDRVFAHLGPLPPFIISQEEMDD
jgi:hypothetical protein